jgi:hypothetical protein
MARRSSGRILAALEGKLGGIRREVSKVLRGLKREIARRDSDLAAVKAEFTRGMDILRGRAKVRPAPARRRARRRPRRARRVNWKAVFASLPARFTLKTLARHPWRASGPNRNCTPFFPAGRRTGCWRKIPGAGTGR